MSDQDEEEGFERDQDGNPYLELREEIPGKKPGEESVSRLTFTGLHVGQLRALDKMTGNVAKGIALISRCAGVPERVVDRMDARDFSKAQEIVAGFFGVSLEDETDT